MQKLLQALNLAAEKHKLQRRAGYPPIPYVNHLIKVTTALIEIGKEENEDLLIAAVLHDVVEDSDLTVADIAKQFGEQVATIVGELTDDMSLEYNHRKQLQVDNAKNLSIPAQKIRIADKTSNLEDIFSYPLEWPQTKKIAYLENSIKVVDQIRGVSVPLENWFDEMVEFVKTKI